MLPRAMHKSAITSRACLHGPFEGSFSYPRLVVADLWTNLDCNKTKTSLIPIGEVLWLHVRYDLANVERM
jgi:hypothetical protein